MYPRNAASPERIAIGPVVQISDGAVQTSGCTVRIRAQGESEGDGGGTTAYSTDGVVLYTPTQAETNYTSFVLIAKKTGCIPASVTVVTSASATAGKVVLSGETHTSAVIPTVTNLTNAPTNGDLTATMKTSVTTAATAATPTAAAVTGAVGSVTAAVTVGTNNDKTGYALTSAYDAAKSALTTLGTNAPANWINAAAIANDALDGKGDWSTYAGGDTAGTTTLLGRVVGTIAAGTHNAQSGDGFAILSAITEAV